MTADELRLITENACAARPELPRSLVDEMKQTAEAGGDFVMWSGWPDVRLLENLKSKGFTLHREVLFGEESCRISWE